MTIDTDEQKAVAKSMLQKILQYAYTNDYYNTNIKSIVKDIGREMGLFDTYKQVHIAFPTSEKVAAIMMSERIYSPHSLGCLPYEWCELYQIGYDVLIEFGQEDERGGGSTLHLKIGQSAEKLWDEACIYIKALSERNPAFYKNVIDLITKWEVPKHLLKCLG